MTPTWGEAIQHLTEYLGPIEPESRRAILLYLSERVFPAEGTHELCEKEGTAAVDRRATAR